MVYQVVAKQRTGSTIVNLFAVRHNDDFGFNEFFLSNHVLHDGVVYKLSHVVPLDPESNQIDQKFRFLEQKKDQDIHFSLKIVPHNLLLLGYEKQLISYLKDYTIVTIDRDPFETFLSWSYQKATKWVTPHNTININPQEVKYYVQTAWINEFVDMWKLESAFINMLNTTKIDYSDLSVDYLQDFFDVNYTPKFFPMAIDYRNLIKNLSEVEHYFYKSLNYVG